MKLSKRLLALSLVAAITCGAAGCSSSASSSSPPSSTPPSPTSSEAPGEAASLLPLKEPMEFTIAVKKHALSKNNYADKEAVKQAEAATGVKINWMEIPSSGWNDKINLFFSSGELPDAILGDISSDIFVQNTRQLAPLNALIAKHSPVTQQIFAENPEVKRAMTAPDGEVYSLLTNFMAVPRETTKALFYINKSWLDKLSLPVPTTSDELYQTLKAFKEKDPNGNGKADEIPFAFCQADWVGHLDAMFGQFGVLGGERHVLIEDGKVVFQPTQDGYKEALQFFNKLVSEGLLDSEGFTQTTEQYYSKGSTGNYGVFPEFGPQYVVGDELSANYVALAPLKGPAGDQLYQGSTTAYVGSTTAFMISNKCKNPEILMEWYDYQNRDFESKMAWNYGPKDVLWNMQPDGQWVSISDNVPAGMTWDDMRYTVGCGSASPVFFDRKDSNLRVLDTVAQDRLKAVQSCEPYYPKESLPTILEDPAIASARNKLYAEINSYVNNFVATSVLKGVTDAQWSTHLETCKKLKSEEYVQMWQTSYDTAMQTK